MTFIELNPPVIELPENQTWHRVQRTRTISASVRLNGYLLPPTGLLTGRFDLPDELLAYLANSEDTALYEAVFRREVHSYPLQRLEERSLASFETTKRLRVAALRGWKNGTPSYSPRVYLPCPSRHLWILAVQVRALHTP
jgi:hypothetical protein